MLSLPLHSPPSAPRVKAERSQHEGENCHPPPSAPRVKAERSQHEGKHRHPPPSAPAAWERKGAGGKVRATRRAPQHRLGSAVNQTNRLNDHRAPISYTNRIKADTTNLFHLFSYAIERETVGGHICTRHEGKRD